MKDLFVSLVCSSCLVFGMAFVAHGQDLGSDTTFVHFNGAVDITYYNYEEDGLKNGNAIFDLYEAYLASSVDIAPKVTSYLEVRYEHGSEEIALRQGYMDWHLAGPLNVRGGKFYMPIGTYRNYYYNALRKFATYPHSMRVINVAPWEEVGLELYGTIPLGNSPVQLMYEIAVVNGLNEGYTENSSDKPRKSRQNRDNNNSKTVGGRMGLSLAQAAIVGFSYSTGKFDDAGMFDLSFLDVDMGLELGDLEVRGEWVLSEAETTAGDVETSGYYVQASYKILKDFAGINYLELAARYDMVDPGQDINDFFRLQANQVSKLTSLGLNVSPKPHFLVKFEYLIADEDDPKLENDAFAAQAVIDF